MRYATHAAACFLLVCWAAIAQADIEVRDSYAPGEPIVVKVLPTDLPAGAETKGTLTVSGVSGTWQPDPLKGEFGVWAVSGPHTVTAIGAWQLVDQDGKARAYGWYQYTKTFTVTGPPDPGPGPNPPGPLPPGEKWQVAFFFESADLDTMPMAQVDMISGQEFKDELKAKGHSFVGGFDKDSRGALISEKCETGVCRTTTAGAKWKAYWDAIAGKTLPCIVIAPIAGGKTQVFPLPANRAELYKLLDGAKRP